MFATLMTRLAERRDYRQTYAALCRLDAVLLADLGLTDLDLRRVSARAARQHETLSVYHLATEFYEEDIRKAVKFQIPAQERCAPEARLRYAQAC